MPRLALEVPLALVLALPVGWILWKHAARRGLTLVLRAAALGALVLALAQPVVRLASAGTDLVVVVDRSASMPAGSEARAQEAIRLLEGERRPGDRIAVVGFGRTAEIEQRPEARGAFPGFTRPVDPDASSLVDALERAADLVPPDRRGAILVLSDGRGTQGDLRTTAFRLAGRDLPVSHRVVARPPPERDVAVISIDLPAEVAEREPFQLSAVVRASTGTEAEIRLERDGRPLAIGKRTLIGGDNVLVFRDRVDRAGLARYRLRLSVPGDGVPENDLGEAVLRVRGPSRVLLVSRHGGAVERALVAGGLRVQRVLPGPITLASLEGVDAVALEDVEADALGEASLVALGTFVSQSGGGLVMTGGRRSFGEGGYRRSPVEDVLPVSLEVRQEQRRSSLAMSIVMDCSGSMAMTLGDGRTKMQLAGEGAVAALTLLGPEDEAAVHLIDTEPHTIFDLQPVGDDVPLKKVAKGFSGGGGILVGVALRTARDTILRSAKPTRHVVLFADAADATDPDDYKTVIAELRSRKVTVSVIALGKPTDGDAALLREVAELGGGRIYFAENAASLPRVFSQETLAVSRSSWVDGTVAAKWTSDLMLLGALETPPTLSVSGYSLTYARPGANVGIRSGDDNAAPLLAFHRAGLGRSVAFAPEADGASTGALRRWSGYGALLAQLTRWSLPAAGERVPWTARAERVGDRLHVTLDLEEGAAPPLPAPAATVLREGEPPLPPQALTWEGDGRLGLTLPLQGHATHHPLLRVGDRAARLPPVTLPYSPEFLPARGTEGAENLALLSRLTGGTERTSLAGLFGNAPESEGRVPLSPPLAVLALLAMLAEVWVRRAGMRAAAGRGEEKGRPSSRILPLDAPEASVQAPAPPPPALEDAMTRARTKAKRRF